MAFAKTFRKKSMSHLIELTDPNAPPPPPPTIDASLGVGKVGGVKVYYAALLALVLGVG